MKAKQTKQWIKLKVLFIFCHWFQSWLNNIKFNFSRLGLSEPLIFNPILEHKNLRWRLIFTKIIWISLNFSPGCLKSLILNLTWEYQNIRWQIAFLKIAQISSQSSSWEKPKKKTNYFFFTLKSNFPMFIPFLKIFLYNFCSEKILIQYLIFRFRSDYEVKFEKLWD